MNHLWIFAADDPTGAMSTVRDWVKLAADYGASWVFTVVTLGILIYSAVSLIGLAKKWLPLWIQASMENQKRVAQAVEDLVEVVYCSHDGIHNVKDGLRAAARAVRSLAKKSKEPWPSDVLVHVDNAEHEFGVDNSKNHKRKERPTDDRAA